MNGVLNPLLLALALSLSLQAKAQSQCTQMSPESRSHWEGSYTSAQTQKFKNFLSSFFEKSILDIDSKDIQKSLSTDLFANLDQRLWLKKLGPQPLPQLFISKVRSQLAGLLDQNYYQVIERHLKKTLSVKPEITSSKLGSCHLKQNAFYGNCSNSSVVRIQLSNETCDSSVYFPQLKILVNSELQIQDIFFGSHALLRTNYQRFDDMKYQLGSQWVSYLNQLGQGQITGISNTRRLPASDSEK